VVRLYQIIDIPRHSPYHKREVQKKRDQHSMISIDGGLVCT